MGILAPYLGTLVNFVVVLVFGTVGSFIKKGIPKRFSDAIMSAMAICVIYIGINGVLEKAPATDLAPALSPGLFKVLVMTVSMAIGTVIGELIDFEKWMDKLGKFAARKVGKLGVHFNTVHPNVADAHNAIEGYEYFFAVVILGDWEMLYVHSITHIDSVLTAA